MRANLARSILLSIALSLPLGHAESQRADSSKSTKPDLGRLRTVEFDTDEGTWMNVDVAPDGRTIIFDLLGDIYTMPIDGGEAKILMGGRDWDQMPVFSPDGKQIAFISDRDGQMNLWIANADGSNPKQLSKEYAGRAGNPAWVPEAGGPGATRYVAAMVMRVEASLRVNKHMLFHKDGGSGVTLAVTGTSFGMPAFSPDGRYVYLGLSEGRTHQIARYDRATNETRKLTSRGGFKPRLSPDGKWLTYARRRHAATELRIRDLTSLQERTLIARITNDDSEGCGIQDMLPNYGFTPDGRALIMSIDGKIQRVDVATGAARVIPFTAKVRQQLGELVQVEKKYDESPVKLRVLRWPTISADGKRLAFSGAGQIWIADVNGGGAESVPVTARRLTTSTDLEFAPAFSPDGRSIAYTTWTDTSGGHLMVISAEGRQARQVTTIPGRYANPAWSPDGSKIAFVRGMGTEFRQDQGKYDQQEEIVWVPASGGAPQPVTLASQGVYGLRHQATLTWSPDGSRIQYVEHLSGGTTTGDWLRSVRLDGTDPRAHVHIKYGEELVPSPNGRHLIIGRRDEAWIADLPPYGTQTLQLNLKSPAVPAKRVSTDGAIFPSWQNDSTAVWAFAGKIYRYRVGDSSATVLAEVDAVLPRAIPSGTIAFTNARLVTMRGAEVIERGTIVVKNNRILAVGPSNRVNVPSDATIVNAAGKTIIPGLMDVHDHIGYTDYETVPTQRWELIAHLAYGITTAYDPSANSTDTFSQAEMIEVGRLLGPRMYSSGDVVLGDESPGGVEIRGIADARRIVKRHKLYGTEMLKQYMQPRRDQRQWLAQAAREEGLAITAEGGADMVLDLSMALDGYTSFEHSLPKAPLYKDVIQLLARSGTDYTPTIIVSYGGPEGDIYFHAKTNYHDDPKLRRFTPDEVLDRKRRQQSVPDDEWHWKRVAAAAADIVKAGGRVSTGAHGERHGLGTHWEMWMMQYGGLTPMEALRTATMLPALKLGRDKELGSLEPGKLADFLVLNADPLQKIENSTNIQYTVLNGFVYDAESVTRVWPDYRPLDRFFWQTEADRARVAAPLAKPLGRTPPR